MIKSSKCKETEKIFNGRFSKNLPQKIQKMTDRKLTMLCNVQTLNDLKIPPANRLEALSGTRTGQHSIRINQQWRICFKWNENNASKVEITDYH